jgi:hypothetical protein
VSDRSYPRSGTDSQKRRSLSIYRFATVTGVVLNADRLVIDFSINFARVGTQTHMDLFDDLFNPPAFHGTEPTITRTSNTVEKSAKRRMG